MNDFQIKLYNELMTLVESSEAFYFADQVLDEKIYRIFNYRLCSYTEFCLPSAEECRGHMFEVDENGNGIRLASFPMGKFYNLGENPKTMDLDLSTITEIADKADGSLISTFHHRAPHESFMGIRLKSKGSLFSDQATDAMNYLRKEENHAFAHELDGAEWLGYTIIMEYVAPHNRIVLGYEYEGLHVLGARSCIDGSYISYYDVDVDVFPEIAKRWTSMVDVDETFITKKEFIESIPDMKEDIEGYVVMLESGQRFKVKTLKYLALHHTKDSINSPRRLFEAVLEEATDDMRTLFHDDKLAIKMIEDMELFVEKKYNHMVDSVENFYDQNKQLDRKEYAILGQKELTRMYFGLAMSKYVGKDVDYKAFLKKQWKSLGLKDREETPAG